MKVGQNTFTIKCLGKTRRFRYKYNIQQSWAVIFMARWRYNQILEIINITKLFMTSLFRGQQFISPIKVKSSLYRNYLSAISLICDKNVGSDTWGCLYIDDINDVDTPLLISKRMDSMPKQLHSNLGMRLCAILARNINPPLEEDLSCLWMMYPSTLKWEFGKLSSSLDSLMISKSTKRPRNISCRGANLCL